MKTKATLLPLRRPSPAASDHRRGVPSGGALSKPIPVRHPEWAAARPAGVGGQARPARHLILVGVVAGLLLAGGNLPALASTFTNGDFTMYSEVPWGDDPTAQAVLAGNYNTVFASSLTCSGCLILLPAASSRPSSHILSSISSSRTASGL